MSGDGVSSKVLALRKKKKSQTIEKSEANFRENSERVKSFKLRRSVGIHSTDNYFN